MPSPGSASDWFLTATERDNPATAIDRDRTETHAWSDGNRVEIMIDGRAYFERLFEVLTSLRAADAMCFTDWQGDASERLTGPGSEFGSVLVQLVSRGVDVRGLVWRSHPRQLHFAEQDNFELVRTANAAGAELLLDQRVRSGGCHHQKLVIVRRGDGNDVAFVGGIDVARGRHDDHRHLGDPQRVVLDRRYGARPPWHDVHLEVEGPAVADLDLTFRERWTDPTRLDHGNPLRALLHRLAAQPRRPSPMPSPPRDEQPRGPHAVQVLRTYPVKRRPYPFAPRGERSIARACLKAIARSRRLVYIEDQYLWSPDAAAALAESLRRHPALLVVIVVPRFPDRDGRLSGAASRLARGAVLDELRAAGGDRVAVYDLENGNETPVYVHAKVCIVDDVWIEIGSDNLNRRSWTHDSEVSCAVIDSTLDAREPSDPGGLGDGARVLARDTRLRLWCEHLGRAAADDDDLVDPERGFAALASAAADLDRWHESERRGPRPPGMLRVHRPEAVAAWTRQLAEPFRRAVLDPDGRPRSLRRAGRF